MSLLSALATIKQERERQGLSLAEVSERSGLDKGMISRLETGKIRNPTIHTLWRYVRAVGMALTLSVEKTEPRQASPDPTADTLNSAPSSVATDPRIH
jgi:transcriptional regulator with XRE-family HTH domain